LRRNFFQRVRRRNSNDRIALQLILETQSAGARYAPIWTSSPMRRAVAGDVDSVLDVVKAAGRQPSDVSVLILSTASDLHLKYKLGRGLIKREGRDDGGLTPRTAPQAA
jgi:hypothetical protein